MDDDDYVNNIGNYVICDEKKTQEAMLIDQCKKFVSKMNKIRK